MGRSGEGEKYEKIMGTYIFLSVFENGKSP